MATYTLMQQDYYRTEESPFLRIEAASPDATPDSVTPINPGDEAQQDAARDILEYARANALSVAQAIQGYGYLVPGDGSDAIQ